MIGTPELARTVSAYVHRCPGESLTLSPLWLTLAQHQRAGACVHMGTCPILKVSPVIVDEQHRLLMLRQASRFVLPETGLEEYDTLREAAETLARAAGVEEPWLQPGCEDPIQLFPARAAPEDGDRTRVVIRFLFRTHSGLCRFPDSAPQTWVPLVEVDIDLARRVESFLAEGRA